VIDSWPAQPPTPPPLIGREEVLEEVRRSLSLAERGHGLGLLLVGTRGVGKSHLLGAIADQGSQHGFRVLRGRAFPEELPQPFSLVRELFRSQGREEVPRSTGPEGWMPALLPLAPFQEASTPSLPATPETGRTTSALDELERSLAPLVERGVGGFESSREELHGRVEEYFLHLARDQPLLLVIDDLHFADSSSLEFLWRLAIDIPEVSVVVVATVGTGDEVPDRTRPELEILYRSPAIHRTTLRPFTVPEVTEFVRWIIGGRTPDPQDILRWHTQTDGNPLFVEQLVRSTTGYRSAERPISPVAGKSLEEVLIERIHSLGDTDRRVMAYAAVLGEEFEFPDLLAVTGLSEERVSEAVDRLVQEGFFREKGHESYSFVTEALRANAYADLTETHRRILHEKAGLALEAKGGARETELARHFYLGHDSDRAVRYNLAAAQSATRAFAFEIAATLLSRALEAQRRRPARDVTSEIRLLTEEGRLLTEAGSPHRSEEVLTEALGLARAHPGHELELGRVLLGLAWSRYERGEYTSAEALVTEAWNHFPKVGTSRDLMAAHRVSGLASWRRGDRAQAENHLRAALEIAERDGTPLEQGHALVDVANVTVPTDPVTLAAVLELYDRAASLFAAGENHVAIARVRMNRSMAEWEAGATDASLRDLRLAIESSERAHSPRWVGWCEFNLAELEAELGRTDSARAALERAVRVLTPVGDALAEQQILMARGMIDHADREYETAETHYQDSLVLARRLHTPSDISDVLLRMAQLSHDRGDDSSARDRLAAALASGLLDHHPNFAVRVAALERALASPSQSPPP